MKGSVRGYVVRADTETPVPGATITIVRGPGRAPEMARLTDRNGSFALHELIAGEWHLQAQGPRGEMGEEVVTVFDDSLTDATIMVRGDQPNKTEFWGTVRGRVVRADTGEPIRDAYIDIMHGSNVGHPEEPIATTDNNGRFTLTLPVGEWQLRARNHQGEAGQEVVRIFHDSSTDITIRVTAEERNHTKRGGTVRGRVVRTHSGEPIRHATISVLRGTPDISAVTDRNGSFLLEMPAGDWHLEVKSPEGQHEEFVRVDENSDTNTIIRLSVDAENPGTSRRMSIRGRVVRADTEAPVHEAIITILRGPGPAPDIAISTDRNGVFVFPGLSPGEWHLHAQGPRGEMGEEIVRLHENSQATTTIRLFRKKPIKQNRH